jgi:hypothetical protein
MAGDIMDRLLRDMVREDVILQLGAPAGNATEQEYQYFSDRVAAIRIVGGTFHVYFDSSGHCSHSKIH